MKTILIMLKTGLALIVLLTFSLTIKAQCDAHQALLDNMAQALNEKNPDLLANVYHADAKKHTPDGTIEGLDKMKEGAARFHENIPDATKTIHEAICNGDKLVVRWEGNGTPKMAGKPVKVSGITIYQVKDGKVAEEWEEMSTLSLMMQLGFELKEPEKK